MTKKLTAIFAAMVMMLTSVNVLAVRGQESMWIECEEAYSVKSGDYTVKTDDAASGKKSLKLDSTHEGIHEVMISFPVSRNNEYDIYVLSTPINISWASKYKWKLDGGEYNGIANGIASAYTTQDSRRGGVVWHKMTTAELNRGTHTMGFIVENKRTAGNDFYYNVLDCIVVVPKSWNWKPTNVTDKPFDKSTVSVYCAGGKVPSKEIKQKDTLEIEVTNRADKKTNANPKLYVKLMYNGEEVCSAKEYSMIPMGKWGVGKEYTNKFQLTVPFNAPNGTYQVISGIDGINYANGKEYEQIGEIVVGSEKKNPEKITAAFENVTIPGSMQKNVPFTVSADYKLNREIDFDTTAYVSLWKDGLLYDVLESKTKIQSGEENISFTVTPTSDLPDGTYSAKLGLHRILTENQQEFEVETTGADSSQSRYYKPMSYGFYDAKTVGQTIFWYINQAATAIFNGEPYIPMGGMAVLQYIHAYSADKPEENEKNFEQDKADLEMLRAAGIHDVYINPVPNALQIPVWAWNYILDYLESNGWTYGIQASATVPEEQYIVEKFYPHATESSARFEVKNVSESGQVRLEVSSGFSTSITETVESEFIVVNDKTGEAVQSGKGGLETGEDDMLIFTADVKITDGDSHTVYFVPRVFGSISKSINFWQNREQYNRQLREFSSRLSCGAGFRFFIDITENEMGLYNQIESARIYIPEFNDGFAKWLENKYGSADKLAEAWGMDKAVVGFEEAVKLVPVYTTDKDSENNSYTYYINPDNSEVYKIDTHNAVSWNDYLDARDDMFLEFNNEVADTVKEYTDLPVIYKHCSVQRRYFINKQLKGGFDGLGSEAYGAVEKVAATVGLTSSQCDQFARTAWVLTTETNTEENISLKYSNNEWSYPDKETMFRHFDGMIENGAKGIFDFLLVDRLDAGGMIGKAYSYIENRQAIPWLTEYIDKIYSPEKRKEISEKKYANKTYYLYPQQKNWWWKPNERSAVQLEDDAYPFQRVKTKNGKHVLGTDDLNVNTDVIFININDGPYSEIYGGAVSELLRNENNDKKIVVLGHRNDLGTIPEIDKYFTDEKVQIGDGETVQILNPSPTSEVLKATEDGKVWALKDGELYIIATSAPADSAGEFYELKYVDDLGITE